MTEYAYSFDEELFHGRYASIADALAEAAEHDPEAIDCYIGEVVPFVPGMDHPVASLIEMLSEQAQDECGEYGEDWPDLTDEEAQGLGRVIAEYLEKHSAVTFYTVRKTKRYSLLTGAAWWNSFWESADIDMYGVIQRVISKHKFEWLSDKARMRLEAKGIVGGASC